MRGSMKKQILSPICKLCGEKSANIRDLDHHLSISENCKKFYDWINYWIKSDSCQFCEKSFSCEYNYKKHMFNHHTENPQSEYFCERCDKYFFGQPELSQHKNLYHNQIYQCKKCQEKFIAKAQLQDHEKNYHGENYFTCEICEKQIKWRKNLRIHKKKVHGMVITS